MLINACNPVDEGDRINDAAHAVDELRRAEAKLSRRSANTDGPGESGRAVLRFLLEQVRAGREVSPASVAEHLDISSASVSVLLHRLERLGLVVLLQHPSDGRRKIVAPVDAAGDPDLHDPVTAHIRTLAAELPDHEVVVIARFLQRVTNTIDDENHH